MKRVLFVPLIAACLGGCSGGGAALPPTPQTVAQATPTPGATTPASAPTTKPAGNHIAAAPAQVFTSSGIRKPQSVNLGSGGVPTIVVGYSPTMGAIQAQVYAWAATALNVPVQEASLNVTPLGPITVQAISQDNANLFAATYFDWIINPNSPTGTGKISLVAAFGDGTTGTIPYYSYDKWNLDCGVSTPSTPMQWAYVGGVPKGQVAPADVALDCLGNITFPNGATLLKPPSADAYGNLATQMTTTLSGALGTIVTTVPLANLQTGAIYLVKLNDGGLAKFMSLQSPGVPVSFFGIALHDSPSGSGNFSF